MKVRAETSPIRENNAWCDIGCPWVFSGAPNRYRASRAARLHTEQTGHVTVVERYRNVTFRAEPSDD